MLWQDRNGNWFSTVSPIDMKIMNNTDDFIENAKLVAEKTGHLDLFEEMFGQDSGFMDDQFGG